MRSGLKDKVKATLLDLIHTDGELATGVRLSEKETALLCQLSARDWQDLAKRLLAPGQFARLAWLWACRGEAIRLRLQAMLEGCDGGDSDAQTERIPSQLRSA